LRRGQKPLFFRPFLKRRKPYQKPKTTTGSRERSIGCRPAEFYFEERIEVGVDGTGVVDGQALRERCWIPTESYFATSMSSRLPGIMDFLLKR